ncbi:hypothetical protein HDV02_005749 [Globomyces sp. JEL0801]|nr:hypothetical protein HDV02_005749 [Globomyces sp. JEL0801]
MATPLRKQLAHSRNQTPNKRLSFGGFLSPASNLNSPRSDDRKRSFEEWLQIAADNKINGQNTWNLALIDYFADMTLLREGDSINFQKASYTLDGCVKVYTSRIDSVDSETKNLLLGLVDKDVEDETNPGDSSKQTKRRKQLAKTLEENENLTTDTFEVDLVADPLFQKTAADFDEGGAKGLLLSHLDISIDGKIIFDAGDSAHSSSPTIVDKTTEIDMFGLKEKFGSSMSHIWDQEVCPTFSSFKFNSAENEEYSYQPNREDFYADQFEEISDLDVPNLPAPDFDDESVHDMAPMDDNGWDDSHVDERNNSIMLMIENTEAKTDDNIFTYFGKMKTRNWAGPEYWKSRARHTTVEKQPKAPVKRKPKVMLNFTDCEPIDPAMLFAKSKTTTLLPKSSQLQKGGEDMYLLPEDLKYDSERFMSLFLKPTMKVKQFTKVVRQVPNPNALQQSSSETYISEAAVDIPEEIPEGYMLGGFEDDDDDDDVEPNEVLPVELEDQLPDLETATEAPSELDYGQQLVREPIRVKAKPLVFSRTAKRVDVQKLKENIWDKLSTPLNNKLQSESEPIKFTEIVTELDDCYPEKQRKDISVAFCFICVLHLANENNLQITGSTSMKDLGIMSN